MKPAKPATKAKTAKKPTATKRVAPLKECGQGKGKARKEPFGRPTDYKPEYAALATKFCLLGAYDKDLARMFDVDERTINNWKDAHPDFFQSIKEGKDIADAEVASKLFHRAKGYSHKAVKIVADAKLGIDHSVEYTEHYPPDTAACIFWMKNRQKDKWRDKIDQEISGKNGGPIIIAASQVDEKL